MKILIVSDTHRRDGNLRAIIEKQSPFDMLILGLSFFYEICRTGTKRDGRKNSI